MERTKQVRKMQTRISTETFTEWILSTNIVDNLIKESSHLNTYHNSRRYHDTVKQINRVLDWTPANAETYFYKARDTVENILFESAEQITEWLGDPSNNERLTVHAVSINGEPDGKGVRFRHNKLQECEAYESTAILEKADNEYGFQLITAFPNIMRRTAMPTQRDIRSELHQTRAYKKASEKRKRFLDTCIPKTPISITEDDLKFADKMTQIGL